MAANTVDVVVRLVDQISERLGRVQSALKETDKTGKQVNTTMQALQAGIAGITVAAVYQGLRQVAEGFIEVAQAGAQFERVMTAFQVMTSLSGENYVEVLGSMRVAARGTISDMELMLSANKALSLGVANTGRELSELVKVSTVLGRRTGLGQQQSLERLMVGVGRLSPRILDDLGIAINLTRLFHEETGKAASELDQETKIQILLNKVLKDGAEIMKQYPEGLDDAASGFERLSASWKNFVNEVGQTGPFSLVSSALEDVTAKMFQMSQMQRVWAGEASTADLEESFKRITADITALQEGRQGDLSAQGMQDFINNYGIASEVMKKYQRDLAAVNTQYGLLLFSSRKVGESAAFLAKEHEPVIDVLKNTTKYGTAVINALDRVDAAQKAIKYGELMGDPALVERATAQLKTAQTYLKNMAYAYNIAAEEGEQPLIDEKSLDRGVLLTAEAAAQFDVFAEKQRLAKEAAGDTTDEVKRQVGVLSELERTASSAGKQLRELFLDSGNLSGVTSTYEAAKTSLEGQLYYLENISGAWLTAQQQAEMVNQTYEAGRAAIEAQADALAGITAQRAQVTTGSLIEPIMQDLEDMRKARAMIGTQAISGDPEALARYNALIQALSARLVEYANKYNAAAALAGLPLIDVQALAQGKLALQGAAEGVDIFNQAQREIPAIARAAMSAVRQEAAELGAFRAQIAGYREGLLGDLIGNVDVFGVSGVKQQYTAVNAALEGAERSLGKLHLTEEGRVDAIIQMEAAYRGMLDPISAQASELRKVDTSAGDLADTIESKLKSAYESLEGFVSGELKKTLNELSEVGVDLDEFMPYQDKPAENARRLAAIMKEGIKDQPWLDEFKAEVPGIWDELMASDKPQEAAAAMLRQFEQGLRPELIDWAQLKQSIKDQIETNLRIEGMGKQLTDELISEMGADKAGSIAKFVADALGTSFEDEDFGADGSAKLLAQFSSPEFQLQMRGAGAAGAENWALGFVDAAPEYLVPFIDLLVGYVTPGVEARINAKQGASKSK